MGKLKERKEKNEKPTTRGIPRRSSIQVLTVIGREPVFSVFFFVFFGIPKGEVQCSRVISTGGIYTGGVKMQRGKERHGEGAPSKRPARQTRRGVESRLTESLKIGKHRS